MTLLSRGLLAALVAMLAACGSSTREPVPITPPSEVKNAPVARVPIAPPAEAPSKSPATAVAAAPTRLDPKSIPSGAIYVCASGTGTDRKVTAITFDEKVGAMCSRHPEMGPCQYERNVCRRSGGRVYAADGGEITLAQEAEYDKKVMRVRFKSN